MDQARAPSRSILSCTFCRQKKLRCDRLRPCNSCVKRGLQCVYVNPTPAPRNAPARSTKHLQQRIRQLEELVNVQRKAESIPNKPGFESESQHDSPDDAIASSLGKIHVGDAGMSYVSGAHWAALQDSIADLKDCLEADFSVNQPSQNFHGPALLIGLCPPVDKDDILELIPPKNVTDRLVSRFFNSMEPGVVVLHAPTFQAEYNRFWDNQYDATLTWLSLLFSIMSLAIFVNCRAEGEPASPISNPEEMADEFRVQAAYCLIRDKYTKPSKYTIEALLLYGQTEYFRSPDSQYELWVLFGVVMRLAMRVGLHRDGSRYPGISCFDAEMRRRIWALMSQLESLFSFQMGLPRMIHKGLSDTQLPRNLLDNDFNEQTTTLPPSRPETDFTAVSYLIAKGRIADVFGLITDHVNSTLPGSYQYTVQLDRQLNEAYAAAPSNLQFRGVGQSVTELPVVIIGRYNLDILYQKARCVLHRNYLYDGRSDPRYANSRRICIDSAIKLLRHHATIDAQVQPGGVLYSGRWYLSSLTTHNFVLAAMLLCLELHYISEGSGQIGDGDVYSKEELFSTLQTSRQVWSKYKENSIEASQAWRAITVMLEKLDGSTATTTPATDSHDTSTEGKQNMEVGTQFTSPQTGVESSLYSPAPANQPNFEDSMASMMCVPEDFMMDNSIWDFSHNIDWVQWDATMQNFDMAGNRAGMWANQ
ncbi:fungal-specific transcription factor domain-containing protein [Aspergillus germanicus]